MEDAQVCVNICVNEKKIRVRVVDREGKRKERDRATEILIKKIHRVSDGYMKALGIEVERVSDDEVILTTDMDNVRGVAFLVVAIEALMVAPMIMSADILREAVNNALLGDKNGDQNGDKGAD